MKLNMKSSYLIILITFFALFVIITAILFLWPMIAYLASDSYG